MEGKTTGAAFIMLEPSGENRIIVIPGTNGLVSEELISRRRGLIEESDILMLQMEIPMEANCRAAKLGKEMKKIVILDPSPMPETMPEELLACVDVVKPNETELAQMTGCRTETLEEIRTASRLVLERGAGHVITTWGEKGAVHVWPEGWKHYPAEKVEAVDTTAAGDSFIAAFAWAFDGENFDQAILFANRVAGMTVQKKGAQNSIPSLSEVMGRKDIAVNGGNCI